MNVLITGGAGYLGTELVYALDSLPEVESITVYDNFSRTNYNLFIGKTQLTGNKTQFIEGELLDTRKLKKAVEQADIVVHLAAKVTTPFADQNPHLFEQINHWGTAELVYAVESSRVKKLINLSSISVYGSSEEEVSVGAPLNPRTFYGISKMRGEEHVTRLMQQISTCNIRCGNVYGYSKSMRFDSVINKFMFQAHFKNRITINGDGMQHRSFIHIDKVTAALCHLVTAEWDSVTLDLVDRVMHINEVAGTLKEVYPELEMIFVNQHMRLREIKVLRDARTVEWFPGPERSFKEELEAYKQNFTF